MSGIPPAQYKNYLFSKMKTLGLLQKDKQRSLCNYVYKMLIAIVCLCVISCSTDDDPENKKNYGNGMDGSTMYVEMSDAGTLASHLSDSTMWKITKLKISGELNGTDFWLLRQMCGRDNNFYSSSATTKGVLGYLDLSEAKVVAGGRAYYGNYTTENDIFPKSVFYDCPSLTYIYLPKVKEFGEYALCNCKGLVKADIPEGIEDISSLFRGCESLTEVEIPSSVTDMRYAFYQCTSLTKVNIPEGIKDISETFRWCSSLTEIEVPSSVENMKYAFEYCTSLTKVNIPEGIKDIGETFRWCSSLTEIEVPSSVENMSSAFDGCTSLTKVNIPEGVKDITCAFRNCRSLTEIELPSSVENMSSAFDGCSFRDMYIHITKITIFTASYSIPPKIHTLHVPKGQADRYKYYTEDYYLLWDCIKVSNIDNIVEMEE